MLYPTSSGFKLGWVDGLYQIERNENPPASEPAGNESTHSGSNSESIAANMVDYELSQLGVGDRRGNNNVEYNTGYYNRAVMETGRLLNLQETQREKLIIRMYGDMQHRVIDDLHIQITKFSTRLAEFIAEKVVT